MTAKLKEGDKAPEFAATDAEGKTVRLKDLRGKKVVLYFYPKDDTPGCTVEACQFNDNLTAFQSLGIPHDTTLRDFADRPHRITDGEPIAGLFA